MEKDVEERIKNVRVRLNTGKDVPLSDLKGEDVDDEKLEMMANAANRKPYDPSDHKTSEPWWAKGTNEGR